MPGAADPVASAAGTLVRPNVRLGVRVSEAGAHCVCSLPRVEPLQGEKTDGDSEQKACGDRLHGAILLGGD